MDKQTKTTGLTTFTDRLRECHLSPERIVAALTASVMLAYIVQLLSHGGFAELASYYTGINFAVFFVVMAVALAALIVLTLLLRQRLIIPWALFITALTVSVLFAANYPDGGAVFCLGIGVVDLIIVLWEVRDDKLGLSGINISRKVALIAACVLFVVMTVVFGYLTTAKYRAYANFTFDFGIFAQMYERMATSFAPETTVERSHMMSHFGVHFSPIFYLFLPGYFIFRTPIYLFFVQAGSVAAGVFAVYLIAGKLGFSGKLTLACELMYAFYPCLINGTFYDFHENKFLTTIILFLFYFILCKNTVWEFVFAVLLLSVKEDAAIYLIVIALFMMINRKELARGGIMLAMAIVYFIIAQQIVAASGSDGVMISRLSDYFVNGQPGFISVMKAIFFDVGFLIKQMFTAEKLPFVLWMLLPVCVAPFFTKKISSLLLLFPMVPINLMQSWQYQYDVNFQYTYGTAALILVSTFLIIAELKTNKKRVIVLVSLCMCAVMSASLWIPKINTAKSYLDSENGSPKQVSELLETIPTDATVTAAHALVPHLYKVKWLYTMPDYYTAKRDNPIDTDYFVIDTRYGDLADQMKQTMGDNYNLIQTAGFAELYQHK